MGAAGWAIAAGLAVHLPGLDPVAVELRQGAAIAIQDRSLDVRGAEGTVRRPAWEGGTADLVTLVYRDGADAILGPAGGREAHLAAQVAARAKGRFLLLLPWASDRALTRVRIPWIFRLASDDGRQSRALLASMVKRDRVLALWDRSGFDSRQTVEALKVAAGALHRSIALVDASVGADWAARAVRHRGPIVVILPPERAAEVVSLLRAKGSEAPLYGPLWLASSAFLRRAGASAEGMILASPPTDGLGWDDFRASYGKRFGEAPQVAAALGHDGIVAIERARDIAKRSGGRLEESLRTLAFHGLTGWVCFDETGNRAGACPLSHVRNGRLEPVKKGTRT